MYEAFYQLSADPFRLSPDPAFSYQHRTYLKALTHMRHALRRAEGFIMITGQPGTGKTTLVTDLVGTLNVEQVTVAKIVSTQLTSNDLLKLVAYSFDLDPEGWSKAKVLTQVERFLKQQYQQGKHPLLIVDEAQGMDEAALEELRLLTNMLVGNHQLLQVFLVGQEQLRDTVNTPSLEQLQQRLIATTFLEPLDTEDTRAYIKHRLHCVNWKGDPLLSTETYAIIQHYSKGIPRRINQICSRLFLHGSTEEKHRLGTADLEIVVEELQQELLLPMDKESFYELAPWPVDQYEETYEEEPQTSPSASKALRPAIETQPGAATWPHMPTGEPISVASPEESAGNTHADIYRKKHQWQPKLQALLAVPGNYASKGTRLLCDRTKNVDRPAMLGGVVLVPVLITAMLAAYFSNSDNDPSVPDQDALALNQPLTQQPVQTTSVDNDVIPVIPRPQTPTAEEINNTGSGNSTGAAGSNTPGARDKFAMLAIETVQQSAPEPDPVETLLSAPQITDIPALSQDNQAEEAAIPAPVEDVVVAAAPLSKEEKIAVLLANGQRSLRQYKLLIPINNNAYYYFQQTLKLDPGNNDASYGLEQIVARYTTLATSALDKNEMKKAEQYITRGFRVNPNNEGLQALREQMNSPPVNTPPVKIAPVSEPEGVFTRIKDFFSQPPNEKIEEESLVDEP
jgi:type II secretory pathway predicted ATPase ExeA